MAKEAEHRLIVQTRGNTVAIICEECDLPFMTISPGRAKVLSKHGPKKHENDLTESDIELVLMLVKTLQPGAKPPDVL